MDQETLLRLLEEVKKGSVSPQDASAKLARLPFEDIGFAKVDHHRSLRTGLPEVILASGKTPEQVAEIFERMAASGVEVLATRADASTFDAVRQRVPTAKYFPVPRAITLRQKEKIADPNQPRIAVVCAGTSDIPVAEEAAVTIDTFGGEVDRFYDVGVAGLHALQHEIVWRLESDRTQPDALAEAWWRLGLVEETQAYHQPLSPKARYPFAARSLDAYEHAVALAPLSEKYLISAGSQELNLDRVASAQTYFERARDVDPTSAQAWVGLGEVALYRGDRATAVRYLARARRIDPTLPAVQRLDAKLRS
jgi:tetratricopeptide (TPR) repeat protein